MVPRGCLALCIGLVTAEAITINVSPGNGPCAPRTGNDAPGEPEGGWASLDDRPLQCGIYKAMPGDTVLLAAGEYQEAVQTVRDGLPDRKITIKGASKKGTRITGAGVSNRIFQVFHSNIRIIKLTIDGQWQNNGVREDYRDKCLYVVGSGETLTIIRNDGDRPDYESSIDGFELIRTRILNCGGECVRLRYFVTNAVIRNNLVQRCGRYDALFDNLNDDTPAYNGEGIYLGTSSSQWCSDIARNGMDRSQYNRIYSNNIKTFMSEGIDVKEGASLNEIYNNRVRKSVQETTGGIQIRGDNNHVYENQVTGCTTAGVRIGGSTTAKAGGGSYQWGKNNKVTDNVLDNNLNGPVKVMVAPQAEICGNSCSTGRCDPTVLSSKDDELRDWDQACGVLSPLGPPTYPQFEGCPAALVAPALVVEAIEAQPAGGDAVSLII